MILSESSELTEIYIYLNSEKHSSFYWPNLELEKKLRDFAYDLENDEKLRNYILLEYDILHLQMAPDNLSDFDIDSLLFSNITINYTEYFEERIKQVANPFLLARYNHILWLSKKNNNFAIEAITNYMAVKKIVIKQENKNWALDLLECLIRSFLIKRKVKDKAAAFDIEQEILSTIPKYLNSEWGLCICMRLLNVIHSFHKIFKGILRNDLLYDINQYATSLINKGESFNAMRVLKSIIEIADKMNYDTTAMYENLATANESYIKESNKSFAGVNFCLEAIRIYTKLKNNQKVEELKKIYEEITSKMRFGAVKTNLNIESLIKDTREEIAQLQEFSAIELIDFFVYDKLLIPSEKLIIAQIDKGKDEGFLMSLLGGNYNIFDQRGNLVKICSTDEEKKWNKIMHTYRFFMEFYNIKLDLVLEALITTGKITFKDISWYMMNNTWLTHNFMISFTNGQEIIYTYSNILNTLLAEYFNLFNKYLAYEKLTHSDFIMLIDSLTLKIEGMIRELFTLKKYPTIIQNYNTNTVQEKDLNALLRDSHVKTFLDVDELLFYRYLFTEQEGLNLRNRIAHSLFFEQEYDMGLANLLFIALLRLFKFEIKSDKKIIGNKE